MGSRDLDWSTKTPMVASLVAQRSTPEIDQSILDRLSEGLPLLADLFHGDVHVYTTSDDGQANRVVAEASPRTVPSIHQQSMLGRVVSRQDEPGVARALAGLKPAVRTNRVFAHGIPTQQDVWAIASGGRIIGALCVEIGLLECERHRRKSVVYRRAVDQVRRMALRGQLEGSRNLSALSEHDGPMIVDNRGSILYISSIAENLYRKLGYTQSLLGRNVTNLQTDESVFFKTVESGACVEQLVQEGPLTWVKRAIPLVASTRIGWLQRLARDTSEIDGVLVIIRDVTGERQREQELRIKSAMIKEIHHRVKNNLQTIAALLRLQARRTGSPEIGDILKQTINRILSIAVVHEYLSHEEESIVNLRDMCQRIINEVMQGVVDPEKRVRFSLDGADLLLPTQQATSCALIINELLQNTVKHAFSQRTDGRVDVHLRDDGEQLQIEILDDGAGLSPGFTQKSERSLGLQIVHTLVREDLKGQFDLQAREGRGVRATVTFPKIYRQSASTSGS